MTLLTENYENAKLILDDFPMLANVNVTDVMEWNKPNPAGYYCDDTNAIKLIVPNLMNAWTLTHEYGHALSNWYFNRCLDIGKSNLPSHYLRRVACTEQIMSLELRFASVTGASKRDAPSKYGRTNWSEFGAECMRDYYSNPECAPISKRYHELVTRWVHTLQY